MPAINPSLKARDGDSFSRLLRIGTKASHDRKERLNGGNEAVNSTPEITASNILR